MKRRRSVLGMTLIELLIAVSIFSVVGLAVYSAFSQGLRLWKRARQPSLVFETSVLFEKLNRELRNLLYYQETAMEGGKDKVSFYSRSRQGQPVKVEYELNRKEHQLVRRETHYYQMLYPAGYQSIIEKPKPILDGVRGFELAYYEFDKRRSEPKWSFQWQKVCLPEAVKITLDLEQGRGRKISRMIPMPLGGCIT